MFGKSKEEKEKTKAEKARLKAEKVKAKKEKKEVVESAVVVQEPIEESKAEVEIEETKTEALNYNHVIGVPADRPEGAPHPSECICEYETKSAFIYKLKNHRKVIINK